MFGELETGTLGVLPTRAGTAWSQHVLVLNSTTNFLYCNFDTLDENSFSETSILYFPMQNIKEF